MNPAVFDAACDRLPWPNVVTWVMTVYEFEAKVGSKATTISYKRDSKKQTIRKVTRRQFRFPDVVFSLRGPTYMQF